jgi:hypothetical protein
VDSRTFSRDSASKETLVGVDYIVDLPCTPKSDLSLPTLIGLIKGRNQANAVLTLARREGDQSPPAAVEFGRSRQTSDRMTIETVSAGALLDQAAKLQPYEPSCAGCPANVLREPFGCYGSLAYPIPAGVERWLMDRLPQSLESTAGGLLQAGIEDFGYDGATIADMRRHRGLFFERAEPARRAWRTGFLRSWALSSNQLLEMMIGLGNLAPAHCAMLALFLGVVPHDSPAELIRDTVAWKQALARSHVLAHEGHPQVRSWISFLNALGTAAALNVQCLIDR